MTEDIIDDEDGGRERIDAINASIDRQRESVDLLHKLYSPTGVPRDEKESITRANLRLNALMWYLEQKGLIDAVEFEKYCAEYMEWYIDHTANRTSEEYGKYYIDID
jgi:hypothetical protein